MNRNEIRIEVIKLVFRREFIDDALIDYELDYQLEKISGIKAKKEEKEEIVKRYMGVKDHIDEYDKIIDSLSLNWNIKRLNKVDLAILRNALFEINELDDIPPQVSINEAVNIGKIFGGEDSGKFINGILRKYFQDKEK